MPTRLFDPNIFDPDLFDTEGRTDMPSPNSITSTLQVDFRWKNSSSGLSSTTIQGTRSVNAPFVSGNGTTALQVDEIYTSQRSLAAGANETLDLAGAITGQISGTVDFSKIKAVFLELPATKADGSNQSSRVDFGGAASNPWLGFLTDASDKLKLLKGGSITIAVPTVSGMAVAAGTADKLFIENKDGSNAALYNIVLLGNQ